MSRRGIKLSEFDRQFLLSTDEFFGMREKAVMRFAREGRGLPQELALALFVNGYGAIYHVDQLAMNTRVYVDPDQFSNWLGKKGLGASRTPLPTLEKELLAAKAKRMKENARIEAFHQIFGTLDRTSGRAVVRLPKTGYQLDVSQFLGLGRLYGDIDGWSVLVGRQLSQDIQDEVVRLCDRIDDIERVM